MTGVTTPISPEEHAKRWGRSPPTTSNSTRPTTATGSVSARVAAFEAASLSGGRAYERIPLPPSPVKTAFAEGGGAAGGQQRAGGTATSPTVPASFFRQQRKSPVGMGEAGAKSGAGGGAGGYFPRAQQGQARETTATATATAGKGDKENQQQQQGRSAAPPQHHQPTTQQPPSARRAAPPSAIPLHPTSASPPSIPLPLASPLSLLSASYSPSIDGGSEVSVCTMATRSSDSTHASSLVSGVNSAEEAKVGVARRVQVEPVGRRQQAPRIMETAPTPKKSAPSAGGQHFQAPRLAPQQLPIAAQFQSQQQQAVPPPHPFQQPPSQPQPQRALSAFSESLPASYPSPSSPTSPYANVEQQGFRPLPLDHVPEQKGGGGRKRANTLGAREGQQEALGGGAVVETREERERRVDEAFGRLLVSSSALSLSVLVVLGRDADLAPCPRAQDTMQLPDPSVRQKMLSLALPLKEEMLRSASASPSSSSTLSPAARPSHSRGRSLNIDSSAHSPNLTPIQTHQVPFLTAKEGKKEKRARSNSFGSALAGGVRKTKSSQSLRASAASATVATSTEQPSRPSTSHSHSRTPSATSLLFRSLGRSTPSPSYPSEPTANEEDATFWAVRIRSASVGVLQVKEVGRLRGRLRSEKTGWVEEFLRQGGYKGLLERLGEVLGVEWR